MAKAAEVEVGGWWPREGSELALGVYEHAVGGVTGEAETPMKGGVYLSSPLGGPR